MDNHITGIDFCVDIFRRGFRFHINGEELLCRGTLEPLSPELLQQLKHRKSEILSYFKSVQPNIRSIHLYEAARLYRERGWVKIFSVYLKTELYLIRDKSVNVPDPTILKYTQTEMDALGDLSLDELRTLHQAKVIFKGTIHRGDNNKMEDV